MMIVQSSTGVNKVLLSLLVLLVNSPSFNKTSFWQKWKLEIEEKPFTKEKSAYNGQIYSFMQNRYPKRKHCCCYLNTCKPEKAFICYLIWVMEMLLIFIYFDFAKHFDTVPYKSY